MIFHAKVGKGGMNLYPRTLKVARQEPDWTKCICHVQEVKDNLSGFNDQSWETLKKAAEIRKDQIFLQLKRPLGQRSHWF